MIPRCPLCAGFAGTSRTAAGKRMWCTTPGCTWSAVVAEDALTGRDMCAVGHYINNHCGPSVMVVDEYARLDVNPPATESDESGSTNGFTFFC